MAPSIFEFCDFFVDGISNRLGRVEKPIREPSGREARTRNWPKSISKVVRVLRTAFGSRSLRVPMARQAKHLAGCVKR
jgi:hypothetical protein